MSSEVMSELICPTGSGRREGGKGILVIIGCSGIDAGDRTGGKQGRWHVPTNDPASSGFSPLLFPKGDKTEAHPGSFRQDGKFQMLIAMLSAVIQRRMTGNGHSDHHA
ncbi:uncharacterized protein GGS25DRAFT_470485 [Hypoxylon fragiforme]|uniref:uncharacterized protein n=1 Tax=Hypoxylon fragiforme TaxID=63214 RepID=UPI0020C6037F|nr:uncharacterized protein GGS25DRAFT_470485 [Hypoxylon fragiforme]KAI2614140.1 hypothetical protein GGS25DRAFT_470485 [Hypoxylon fragiforme]